MGPAGMYSRKKLFDQLFSCLAFCETQQLYQTPPIPKHAKVITVNLFGGNGRQAMGKVPSGIVAPAREDHPSAKSLAGPKATKYLTDLGSSSHSANGDYVSCIHWP